VQQWIGSLGWLHWCVKSTHSTKILHGVSLTCLQSPVAHLRMISPLHPCSCIDDCNHVCWILLLRIPSIWFSQSSCSINYGPIDLYLAPATPCNNVLIINICGDVKSFDENHTTRITQRFTSCKESEIRTSNHAQSTATSITEYNENLEPVCWPNISSGRTHCWWRGAGICWQFINKHTPLGTTLYVTTYLLKYFEVYQSYLHNKSENVYWNQLHQVERTVK
jgi:hypothetical protein